MFHCILIRTFRPLRSVFNGGSQDTEYPERICFLSNSGEKYFFFLVRQRSFKRNKISEIWQTRNLLVFRQCHSKFQRISNKNPLEWKLISSFFHFSNSTELYQKRHKKERKARIRFQQKFHAELKRRNQIEEALKTSGAPADALRLLTGKITDKHFSPFYFPSWSNRMFSLSF